MRVELLTEGGEHVFQDVIPQFNPMPKVIIWGCRVFLYFNTFVRNGEPCHEYRETWAYEIPTYPTGGYQPPRTRGGQS